MIDYFIIHNGLNRAATVEKTGLSVAERQADEANKIISLHLLDDCYSNAYAKHDG